MSEKLGTNLAEVGADTISRKQAIGCLRDGQICGDYCRRAIEQLPPAQPHTYRGVTLNDVMMYFDSLEGNEDAWTEFCSCLECRGWGLYHIQSATDKNVGTNEDCISRWAAIDALDEQIAQCNKAIKSFVLSMKDEYATKVEKASLTAFRERLEYLPPAQPEYHEIGYRECADAVLKMWMDNVLTDGEHNRIIDKLNAKWAIAEGDAE